MNLDAKTLRLIAVGASVAANCQPCLQTNLALAREEGLSEAELAEALDVGRRLRLSAARKMDSLIENLAHSASIDSFAAACGCGAAEPQAEVQNA